MSNEKFMLHVAPERKSSSPSIDRTHKKCLLNYTKIANIMYIYRLYIFEAFTNIYNTIKVLDSDTSCQCQMKCGNKSWGEWIGWCLHFDWLADLQTLPSLGYKSWRLCLGCAKLHWWNSAMRKTLNKNTVCAIKLINFNTLELTFPDRLLPMRFKLHVFRLSRANSVDVGTFWWLGTCLALGKKQQPEDFIFLHSQSADKTFCKTAVCNAKWRGVRVHTVDARCH